MFSHQDDWEELLGQLDILIHEREAAQAAARNLQAHQDTMDEDLENYVRELERIDRADNPMLSKSREMQVSTALWGPGYLGRSSSQKRPPTF